MIPILSKFFSVDYMLKNEQKVGEIPSSKQVYKNFFKIAWPSAIEALLVGLVGSIDTIMVGKLGEGAIAAVGITNQPKFILLSMVMSLNVGITAIVARRKGENDRNGANRVLRMGILLSGTISFLMACLGYIFAEPLLRFVGADNSYIKDAIDFFRILMVSIFFSSLNLTINAAQRGCGKTKISMRTNIVSNVVNVIFNYLLINGILFFPELKVKGAAIATCLGAMAACLISFITLLKQTEFLTLRMKVKWKLEKLILSPVLKVSSSAFVEQVFMRIGFLVYAIIVANLGTTSYATHQICMNILSLSFCFGDGLAIAASSLVGQNLGAKRPDMAMIYGKTGQRLAFVVSSVLFFVFIFARTPLVALFSDEQAIITLGSNILIIVALSTHAQTSQVVCTGCLRGAGDSAFVAVSSFISIAVIRPLLTYILCYPLNFGLYGAWIGLLVDQTVRFFITFIRFSKGKWTRIIL